MAFEGVRNFLARQVTGSVKVFRIDDFNLDLPETHKLKSSVEVTHFKPELKISVSKPFDFNGKIECTAKNIKFMLNNSVRTKKYKIKKYSKHDINVQKFSLNKKIKTQKPLKQIQALPQERHNLIKFQKKRPNLASNEMILAWYWPIVDKSVIKLVLNKQRGTLLVWYSSSSRHNKARGVYLIRRLGLGEKPEWRWV